MNSLNRRFDPLILVSAGALLCVLFASRMIQVEASNDVAAKRPSVELRASRTSITYPCPPCTHSMSRTCPAEFEPRVELTATAVGFNQRDVYSYAITGGRIVGEGSQVIWDLSYCSPGVYTATVEVQDKKHRASASVAVTISNCGDCVDGDCHCPAIVVNCYDAVRAGTPITCKVKVAGARSQPMFEWSARTSKGEDLSDKIRRTGEYISIPTNDLAGRVVYVTVDLRGLDQSCTSTASGSSVVKP